MRYNQLGCTGLFVSELCLGTMTFGAGEGMWKAIGGLGQKDGTLVARVDLKADRQDGALRVQRAHAEPDAPEPTAARLAAELRFAARWLDLERVVVADDRGLGAALRESLATT